jgi:hypothetical protein
MRARPALGSCAGMITAGPKIAQPCLVTPVINQVSQLLGDKLLASLTVTENGFYLDLHGRHRCHIRTMLNPSDA